jgi:hypothetical protein
MSRILITNPAHDDATRYLFQYSKPIISLAKSKGYDVKEFSFGEVKKNEIESFILKQNPKLIIFHGHGSNDSISGFEKNEIIIKSEVNDHILKDKIIHSITCSSAAILGKTAVKKGCDAFIGFNDEFWCPYNPTYMSNPENDILAKCNIEPLMVLSQCLIKNNTVKESYKRSRDCFKKWLDFCHRSDAPPEVDGVAQFIFWNMTHQEIIGNENGKF